ncbi:hypothetical protein GR328_12395 [Microvirga makkahensis]|uniref:Uncharacterized protein n=2 Tax=Microvirga makkahensis TaxID=1128670 RepID=A0A7X3MS53_9HYPH|nr:hypothetical protein [Microvirga makkahensis]
MGRMALAIGAPGFQPFLRTLGQFGRILTELAESSTPNVPSRWSDVTAAFGHGIGRISPAGCALGPIRIDGKTGTSEKVVSDATRRRR